MPWFGGGASNFDARDTFRDKDDRNISTEIVKRTFQLTLMSLDEDNSEQDFSGTVCSRVESTDGYIGDYNKTIWSDDKEKNASFTVSRAIGGDINATLYIKWFKNNTNAECSTNTNDTNATDEFAIRPKDFNISDYPASIYAGEDFNISFEALNYDDANATDYNESNGSSFDINVSEIKSGCETGIYSGNVTFSDGGNTTVANYSEVGVIDINISDTDRNCSDRFAGVDCKDKNVTDYWNSDVNTSIGSHDINITVLLHHFKVTSQFSNFDTDNNFTYLSQDLNMSAILDINITAQNEQNVTTENYNQECYAKDTNYTISYKAINNSLTKIFYHDTNTSDKNETDLNKSIVFDRNNTVFVTGDKNGTAHIHLLINFDRNYSKPLDPFDFNITDINVTDVNNIFGKTAPDKNATFYYAQTYTQDLTTSKEDDNTTVEILVYDSNATNGFVDGFKEELLDWYVMQKHTTANDGNISDSNISSSTNKNDSVESSSFKTSTGFKRNGVFDVRVQNKAPKTGTYFIHLGEDSYLWYVPQNFGGDYNYSDDSKCTTHPCIKYTYNKENNNTKQSGVQSGNTNGVQFDVNVSNNNRGVRLFR